MNEQFANDALTTLSDNVGVPDTEITVTDPSVFPTEGQFRIRVDAEIMLVTGVSDDVFTVVRGYEDTTAVEHRISSMVYLTLTAGVLYTIWNSRVRWQGAWSAVVTYEPNDAVSSGGSSYICTAESFNNAPPNATYWDVLAAKGDTGANGTNGTNGAPGSVWYEGAGAPTGGTGVNGDFYLNTTNGDVYQKAAGSWSVVGNIKGPTGATGAAGAANVKEGNIGGEPGSPASGDMYFVDNGFVVERYTGSIWQPFGPLFKLTPPINGNYAWINQGGATITDNGNSGVILYAPASGSPSMRIRKKAAPTKPYNIDTLMLVTGQVLASVRPCVGWRESSTGKLVVFYLGSDGGVAFKFMGDKWTNSTTVSS